MPDYDDEEVTCAYCGEEITDMSKASPNTDPWGGVHSYFCDDDCQSNASEEYAERQAERFYGGSEPFTAHEIMQAAERQREELRGW